MKTTLSIVSYPKATNALISVGFGYKGVCPHALHCLKTGQPALIVSGAEEATLLYVLFKSVETALTGDVKLQMTYGITGFCCNYVDGCAVLSVSCKNNYTAVRKCITAIMKSMTPMKLNGPYSQLIKSSKDVFNYHATEMNKSISGVSVKVIGKLKDNKDEEKKIKEKMDDSLKLQDNKNPKSKSTLTEMYQTGAVEVKTPNSFVSYLLVSLLNEKNIGAIVLDNHVLINTKNWETTSKKLKGSLDSHMKRYTKSDNVAINYHALLTCCITPDTKVDKTKIKEHLNKLL